MAKYIIFEYMSAPMLSLLSAVAFAAALPNEILPFGNGFLGLVALIPFYHALRIAPDRRTAIGCGALFGAVSTMLSNYWLANFGEFSAWTLGGPTVGYIGYNALLAVILFTLLRAPTKLRPIAFALAWSGYELLKSIGYLGYPWGLAAYSFGDSIALMQIADVTGVYGISFLIVYANASIAEIIGAGSIGSWRRVLAMPAVRHLAIVAMLFALAIGYGAYRLQNLPTAENTVRMALVQQNSDSWATGNLGSTISTLQRLSNEVLSTGEHDVLVWSENSLSLPYEEYRDGYYDRVPAELPLTEFIAQLELPLMTGSPYIPAGSTDTAWNAALLIEPGTGNVMERYGKRQLVPFAEHIPFWELPFVQHFFREVVGLRAIWTMGNEYVLFQIPSASGETVLASAPICFEDAFAGLVRQFTKKGAQVHINMTNNAWSETDSAQLQHFIAARFRAIESRRPLVRSTNSGLTTVVDIDGVPIAELPMFEAAALSVDVPIYPSDSLTVYHMAGDLFAWLAIALTAAGIVAAAYFRWEE